MPPVELKVGQTWVSEFEAGIHDATNHYRLTIVSLTATDAFIKTTNTPLGFNCSLRAIRDCVDNYRYVLEAPCPT